MTAAGDTAALMAAAQAADRPAEILRLARRLDAAESLPGLADVRLAVLASHSLNFLAPFLAVEGLRRGLRLRCYFGAFGQFEQEAADPAGALLAFDPHVVLLAMRPEDIDPDAVARFYATGGARLAQVTAELIGRAEACIGALRDNSSAAVLVANFAPPAQLPLGPFDAAAELGVTAGLAAANTELRARLARLPGALLWDYAGLVREAGAAGWTDPRLWALGRIAVAPVHQPRAARHLVRSLHALLRPPAKCLVLDLDNTLWGGVIGDDGLGGIALGDDYPGNVFKSFQRAALGLMDRGILLAVVSKNEQAVAEQAFREHPEMLIRWDDLAAVRINWEPKSANLRAIAAELNIGADALALFDDNPVERAEVRAGAPEVQVIEVPPDPLGYEQALADCGLFDKPDVSAEDRQRAALYQQDRARQAQARTAGTVEEFLAGLEMRATVGEADDLTLGRIAELVGKTNQFNLTTRRRTLAQLAALRAGGDHLVAWLRLHDRFGDQGLIAVGILAWQGEQAEIDTLLMSCRVMNRRVEHAFVAYLAERARRHGCSSLVGCYLPTAKNAMVRDLYAQLGFAPDGALPDGGGRYRLELGSGNPAWPAVIARRDAEPSHGG